MRNHIERILGMVRRPASADFCANLYSAAQRASQNALLPLIQLHRVSNNPDNSGASVGVHHAIDKFPVQKNIAWPTAIVCGVNVLSVSHGFTSSHNPAVEPTGSIASCFIILPFARRSHQQHR
jgi:hypothetical protein